MNLPKQPLPSSSSPSAPSAPSGVKGPAAARPGAALGVGAGLDTARAGQAADALAQALLTPPPAGIGARAWPLSAVVCAMVAAGMALAAAVAWGASQAFGAAPWAAPLAALLGVAAAALPLAALAARLKAAAANAAPAGVLAEPASVQASAQALTSALAASLPGSASVVPGSQAAVTAAVQVSMAAEGVPRALFMELAAREWARARRYGTGAALLVVDVDRFTRLAQNRGAAATEAVMATLLRLTAPTLRGADLLTRLSDSEMGVFLAHADPTGALDVAERIRERSEQMDVLVGAAVAATGSAAEAPLRVTVSVGVAQLRPAHMNLQALVEDALEATVAARQAGGNCVRAAPVGANALRLPGAWRDDGKRTQPK
jgi:diguanylate cyclase